MCDGAPQNLGKQPVGESSFTTSPLHILQIRKWREILNFRTLSLQKTLDRFSSSYYIIR